MGFEADSKNAALNGTTCRECRRGIIILRGNAVTHVLSHDEWRRKHGCTNSAFLPNHCVRLSSAPGEFGGWVVTFKPLRMPNGYVVTVA